jgi:hypothetical protein
MNELSRDTLVERARAAAARADWPEAYDLLKQAGGADARSPLGGPDLALFANVAYAAGHPNETIEAWERAHAESLRAGDNLAAAGAAVRIAMHLLLDTALMAPVRGWLARAERLLENQAENAVHAWLAVVRNYERLLAGDFPMARHWARRAVELGATWDRAAAAVGRVAEARSLILDGEVKQGLALLEEAAVATVSGELDPISTGMVYCELVCGLQAVAQYDLAEEWTQAMERWSQRDAVGSVHGRCRVHRAEILRLRGSLAEAEREALEACAELRPYLRRELGWPLTELGRIRLQKGDVRGAEEAFVAAHQLGWDPQPGPSLVRLAEGNVAQAAALIRDALDRPLNVPSKELPPNTDLRRAPLLAAQVEIEVAAGEVDRARLAADELDRVASRFESKALAASAALARGRVRLASRDAAGARHDLEAAAHLWNEVRAPYEMAVARMELAQAHRAAGNEADALLELRAARTTFEEIGALHLAERAARASGEPTEDLGVAPARAHVQPTAESTRAQVNEFRREGDFWSIAFEGQLVRLRDLKGLRYLARLLAEPGREFHVLELIAIEAGQAMPAGLDAADTTLAVAALTDAGGMLDERAKQAYRRRLAEIDEDIDEAQAHGDAERRTRAEAEREFLTRELSRAVGLGGRDRRAGAASERARASVTRALRQALTHIGEHHQLLSNHLQRAVRTGTYCAYLPDPRAPAVWNP